MNTSKFTYHFIAIFTVIIWGTTFIATKVLINNGLTPEEIFLYRFSMAYIVTCFFAPKKLFSNTLKDEFLFLLLGLCGGSFYFMAENTALGITLVSNVSLILCTTPILTAVLSFLVYRKDKFTRNFIIGSATALIGVALVIFNGGFILKINPLGDFLTILAAFAWAFYGLLLKRLENNYLTLFITRKVFFYGMITLFPMFWIKPLNFNPNILTKPLVLSNLLFLGLIASMLCFFLWNLAVKHIGMIRVTNYLYIVPLVTLVASKIILNEKITLIALLGSIFILSGVYLAENGVKVKLPRRKLN
ncbi:MAG: DMT family transporter [Flavobacteriaceae bacterium]|nr:DMT family transporter [Flavobacteriaceae bacterium]